MKNPSSNRKVGSIPFAAAYLFILGENEPVMRFQYCLLLFACVLALGCETLGRPNWCNPGSASQQLNQAKQFDPFPDPNIGPPILGGRPEGFMEPRPEPDPVKHQFVPGAAGMPYVGAY